MATDSSKSLTESQLPSTPLTPSSVTAATPTTSTAATRVIKLHLRHEITSPISTATSHLSSTLAGLGQYKSFLITSTDTFATLKYKALDKLNIKRMDYSFYYFSIHFQYSLPNLHQRTPYYPSDHESILAFLEWEELYHEGEILIVFNDHRVNFTSISQPINRSESTIVQNPILSIDTCTEFNQSYTDIIYETIPTTLVNEIESISLKIGRLEIFHSGKDPWREVEALLTDDTLWYNLVNDPHHFLVSIPLPRTPVPYPESDSSCVFSIPGTTISFRTKTRNELDIWIDTINSRSLLCSENDVIFMAEEMCSMGENRKSCRDIDLLSECASFEGTLKNSYLRENFRSFLTSNVAQESLLFWEYAEDFRRGHPNSTQPLIAESNLLPNSVGPPSEAEVTIRNWARAIYDCFIADGSPMQVAIPGESKALIEKVILKETALIEPEIFKQTQNQLFNHLKFQLFPSFIQQTNYRAILMSTINHKVHKCPVTGQVWSHSASTSSPLLLSSPPTLYPSFFSRRLYSRTHRPYKFLSHGAVDPERELLNGSPVPSSSNLPSPPTEAANGWLLGSIITKFRSGMRNSVGTPAPPSIVDQYAEFSAPSSGLVTIKSGGVPTPWREKILLDPAKPPQWLPQYWWTHVDFANDVYFAYDDSYDTSLLKMLPRWTQVIAKRKRSDGKLTAPHRRSVLSSISSIIREFVYSESDTTPSNPTESQPDITPSPESVPPLQLTFRKERTETFVTNDASYDDHFLEYHTSGYDVIAHLPPSTIQSTINFSSHRAGIAALGKNQSLVSNPYEEDPDLRNDSWQCIPVPHLPKSKAFRRRLPMYSILGPIVYSGLMTTRYIAMGNNTSVSSASSTGPLYPAPVDYGSDNTPLDATISPQGAGTPLGNEIDRIVVLSSREDKEGGEIRLYDIVSLQLFAVIRLNSVTKVVPSATLLHIIEIHDATGSVWYLHPGEIHPKQSTSGAKFWLELIVQHCPSHVHTALICHEGYLGKRGQLNTAYKRRWFVLDSEQKLHYFVRWENGQSRLKGDVDVDTINDVAVIGKDLRLATDERIWYFQADTEEEAAFWKVVLSSLIPLKHGIIASSPSSDFAM